MRVSPGLKSDKYDASQTITNGATSIVLPSGFTTLSWAKSCSSPTRFGALTALLPEFVMVQLKRSGSPSFTRFFLANRPLLLSLVRAGMAAGTTTGIAIGSAGNGESAITMNGSGMTQGSGMMPGTITTDIMATGGMTATVVAREATGTTTIETAMRGTTIDRNGAR